VAFSPGENTSCKVVDIVKQIGVEMKVADIEVSHRAGKCTPDRPDKLLSVITVFTVFRLLTDFVCLYDYEFDFPFVRLFGVR
jgi:hypothetical protein